MTRACYWVCFALASLVKQSNANGIVPQSEDEQRRELINRFGGSIGCGGRRFRPTKKITMVVEEHPSLGRATELIKDVNLWDMLTGTGQYTLFAPKNEAFGLDQDLVTRINQPQYSLHAKSLVQQHIVSGQICSNALEQNGKRFDSINGDGFIYINEPGKPYLYSVPPEASLVQQAEPVPIADMDIQAANGVVHTIDRFILPRWAFQDLFDLLADYEFSTMKYLISSAGIEDRLRDTQETRTVFAPTDAAFQILNASHRDCLYRYESIASSILLSHVVDGIISTETQQTKEFDTLEQGVTVSVVSNGDSITVDGNVVIRSDNLAYNGILHGIDTVLLPGQFGCEFYEQAIDQSGTVLGLLEEEGLTTMVALIQKAGLGPFFSKPNANITLFAPIEDAFEDLASQTLFCLVSSNEASKSLLRYHTLTDIHYKADLKVVELFPTADAKRHLLVNGLTAKDGLTQVNDAGIVQGDIIASNGVIHKVSRVVHAVGAECM